MTTWKIKKVYIGDWSGGEAESQFNNSEDGWEPFAIGSFATGSEIWFRKQCPLDDTEGREIT